MECMASWLTSAALAAAPLASSGLRGGFVPSDEPNVRPGLDVVVTFAGMGVRDCVPLAAFVLVLVGLELEPRGRPGVEKLVSLLEDLEQMLPIVCTRDSEVGGRSTEEDRVRLWRGGGGGGGDMAEYRFEM